MFGLFKRKQSLIPKDMLNGILTSTFATFRIGEKIIIPENVVCFVRYKDKTYKEVLAGEYALNKEFLIDLYTKQLKGKDKLKNLKADLYFINLNYFNFEFEFVDKLPLNKIKEKFLINIKMNVQVEDCELFLKNLIYENTAPTAESTKNIIIEFAETNLRKFFLKQNLTSSTLAQEQLNNINKVISKSFKKLGLIANVLDVGLFKKTNNISKKQVYSPKEDLVQENRDSELIKLEEETNNNINSTSNNCPICNNKLIKGSIYCHKCGYKK